MRRRACWSTIAGLGLAGAALACSNPGRVVEHELRVERASPLLLRRIAVAPFRSAQPRREDRVPPVSGGQVARYLAEALAELDVPVVSPNDVGPVDDPASAAAAVAHRFGASALLVGDVVHSREPGAVDGGRFSPAQIGFDVRLYAVGGALVWRASFHYTQQAFTANPLVAIRYPGRGFRWISAAELARWGAGEVAHALVSALSR